jgi:predicted amidohydrolase
LYGRTLRELSGFFLDPANRLRWAGLAGEVILFTFVHSAFMRISVASPSYPHSLGEGLKWAEIFVKQASDAGADIICFPESYLPGYPLIEQQRETCSQAQLQDALERVCEIAAKFSVAVVMPMDWHANGDLLNVAQVISKTGKILGMQTKNQLDPSEDAIWQPGTERNIFELEGVRFGISICHEGFRYPETVRWAARQGAVLVFHPNLTGSNKSGPVLSEWGHRDNPFYEKGQMMRALENTIYFAPCNYSFRYPESASAVIGPDGNCLIHQKYGEAGIITADIDPKQASGLLARRFKPGIYGN